MKNNLLAVALLAVILGGCQAIQNSPIGKVIEKVPGVSESNQQKVTEEMLKDIADPLVRKNIVATYSKGKVRTVSMVGAGKAQYKSITEVDMSGGKYNYKTAEEKNGKIQGEMIFLGETTYAKDYSDNKWWKETNKPEAVTTGEPTTEVIPEAFDLEKETAKSVQATYKKLGEEPCGAMAPGLTCYIYEETYPESMGARKFWFDTKDFLTRKEEQGTGTMKTTSEMTYENISVTAPAPTKDVPKGESIFMMLGKQQYERTMKESGNTNSQDYQKFLKQIDSSGSAPEGVTEVPANESGNEEGSF
jgi:hypothetical protein